MRLGLKTPIVVQHPSSSSPWEKDGTVDDLVAIARAADELGFDHLICSEHAAVPSDVAAERGATYWDPVATLAHVAAATTDVRLATSVMVLGYRHPVALAKQAATLDLLSAGRLVLGVGVGSLREEFELLGAEWDQRGAVADDAMRALRAAFGAESPAYDGTYFSFHDMILRPHPVQDHVPLWVGGSTPRSLRRALELGDGWMPFGLAPEALATMLGATDRPPGFEVVLSPQRILDPLGAPDRTTTALRAVRDAGATIVQVGVAAGSPGHYVDQLHALRALADTID